MDIATSTDLLGVETRSTGFIFSIGKEPLKTRPSVFALGERINILKVTYHHFCSDNDIMFRILKFLSGSIMVVGA
jgi:hypothetical protein